MRAPLATNLAENGQGNDEPTPKGKETKTPFSEASDANFYLSSRSLVWLQRLFTIPTVPAKSELKLSGTDVEHGRRA
ncbi:unnamed protein product [Bursaphelenchus xylophilus]|uniref:(pine wood nematode) hypothetical protein n=1 Tax=Bursaphelenchus xylophilus TaxID=6326 RepID=A0A7I8XGV9_BURXY|nr:unnamed protein product [Bursaphelenchus xylophilus]CAG9081259.1 unnamed protein product [Bursaphelenchus xylophilus]